MSYLELIRDNNPLFIRSRNPHNFDNFAISVTFPATFAYMSGLNIVISGIGPGIGIVQDCWLRFLGIFPDVMKHPSGLSSYHSPDMELGGFAHKIRTLQYTLVTFSLSSRRILSCHSLYRWSVCAILKQPHGMHELRFPDSNIVYTKTVDSVFRAL